MPAQGAYEATINIRHLSTSPKARETLSLDEAMGRAKGNLRYITRDSAIWDGDIIGHSQGVTMIASNHADRQAARERGLLRLSAGSYVRRPVRAFRSA